MKQKIKQIQKVKIKKVYKARVGSPFSQDDAQEVGEFIYERCDGKTTPEILEEVKKHPKSKIYSLIEWDDKKASELYRLERIRNIVNHIHIDIIRIGNSEPIVLSMPIRAFQSVHKIDTTTGMYEGERVYVTAEEGMLNPDYRKQIIERAKTELKNWMDRYNQYQELANIISTIKRLLD